MCTTSWCTCKTGSQVSSTPHGSAILFCCRHYIERARAGNFREAKSEYVLYISRCTTARKFPLCKSEESYHDNTYRKSLVMRHTQGRSLEICVGVTAPPHPTVSRYRTSSRPLHYPSASHMGVAASYWPRFSLELIFRQGVQIAVGECNGVGTSRRRLHQPRQLG